MQLHGFVDEEQLERLRDAGATVFTVAPYLWTVPAEPARVVRMLEAIAARTLDAVTFTSAPAAEALLVAAREHGVYDAVVAALRRDVTPFAVGPVTAAPLHAAGIEAIHPNRYRLGALVRMLVEYLNRAPGAPDRHGSRYAGDPWPVCGHRRPAAPPDTRLPLRCSGCWPTPGARWCRSHAAEVLPDAGDDHALEAAVGRLRQALDNRGFVATVIKRGYRLDI